VQARALAKRRGKARKSVYRFQRKPYATTFTDRPEYAGQKILLLLIIIFDIFHLFDFDRFQKPEGGWG
jgi:hypothetical protein